MAESIPDKILLPPVSGGRARHVLFFIPGNPGLIAYYGPFMERLRTLLAAQHPDEPVAFAGCSLGGFALQDPKVQLVNLEGQIPHVVDSLRACILELNRDQGSGATEKVKVTLLGHSVGAWILLRVIQLLSASSHVQESFELVAGVCLFPTVVDIMKSPNGQRFGWALGLPGAGALLAMSGGGLTALLPQNVLQKTVAWVMGHGNAKQGSEEASAVQTTAAWLGSAIGLRETLTMAAEEMRTIREDSWDDLIWGTTKRVADSPLKLFFYFGKSDVWVADETRDKIIASRAYRSDRVGAESAANRWRTDTRPFMEVDDLGTPHSFCIGHSSKIADKVAAYMQQVF